MRVLVILLLSTELAYAAPKCGAIVVNQNPRVFNSEASYDYILHAMVRNSCVDLPIYNVEGNLMFIDMDGKVIGTEKKPIAEKLMPGEFKEILLHGTKYKMYPGPVEIGGLETTFNK